MANPNTPTPATLLEALGISREDVLESCVNKILSGKIENGDFEDSWLDEIGRVATEKIEAQKVKMIHEAYERVRDTVVGEITKGLETTLMQETTAWGEKRGDEITVREYIAREVNKNFTPVEDRYGAARLPAPLREMMDKMINKECKVLVTQLLSDTTEATVTLLAAFRDEFRHGMSGAADRAMRNLRKEEGK